MGSPASQSAVRRSAGLSVLSCLASVMGSTSSTHRRSAPVFGGSAMLSARARSPRMRPVGDRAMANSGDANGLVGIDELVDAPAGADTQGPQAEQPAAKRVPSAGLLREH